MAVIILPALIVFPWIVRNYLVFDRLILVRDNLGGELAYSNSDCATFSLLWKHGQWLLLQSSSDREPERSAEVLAMGEARYNDSRLREARLWITDNPRKFMSLCVQRFVAFWLPHDRGNLFQIPRNRHDSLFT